VNDTCYCVPHAKVEMLVAAVGVAGGLSTCAAHADGVPVILDPRRWQRAHGCSDCAATAHQSYFVVEDRPLCIRHAADAVFHDDDMGAHDLAHAAYIELNGIGVMDAY